MNMRLFRSHRASLCARSLALEYAATCNDPRVDNGVAPAKEITGGPWYTDQEFDYEFVKHLSAYVLSYVKEQVG